MEQDKSSGEALVPSDKQAGVTVETTRISRRERITNAIGLLIITMAGVASVISGLAKFTNDPSIAIAVVVVLVGIGLFVGWRMLTTKEITTVIPPPPTPEEIQARAEATERELRFLDQWWVRYPVGLGLLLVASYLYDQHPNKWILPLILALFGVLAFRELLFIGIGIGAIWLVVTGLASLPISLAIILGAIVIASAVKNRE